MMFCPPIKRVWGFDPRVLVTIVLSTVGVTLLLMQLRTAATPHTASYETPGWAVAIHLATVLPSLLLGAVILMRRKGGAVHRSLGAVWMAMMVTTSIVSFWIRDESGSLSGIHLFSIGTLVAVPMSLWRIRMGDVRAHRQIMVSLYIGLVVAGLFALDPSRVAGRFLFG